MFQLRRSPASLQREASARAAFFEFFNNSVVPDFGGFFNNTQIPLTVTGSIPGVLNVTYFVVSESSSTSNSDINTAVKNAIQLILSNRCVALLGPNSSSTSKAVSPIATVYKAPHVSYAATSPELSDKLTYPEFFRTPPEDSAQAKAIVQFIQNIGWKRFNVINSLDTYGNTGAKVLISLATSIGLSVPVQQELFAAEMDTGIINQALESIRRSDVRVTVIFMLEGLAARVLTQAKQLNMYGEGYLWMSTDGFSGASFSSYNLNEFSRGFLSFNPLSQFTNPEFETRWNSTYNRPGNILTDYGGLASQGFYSTSADLNPKNYNSYGTTFNNYGYYSYDAMKILLTAIYNLTLSGDCPTDSTLESYRQNLTQKLRSTTTQGLSGDVSFDSNQNRRVAAYEVQNHDGNEWKTIYQWDIDSGFTFTTGYNAENAPIWPSGRTGVSSAPDDEVTVQYKMYSYGTGRLSFVVISALLLMGSIVVGVVFHLNREFAPIKASSPNMMHIINFGGCLMLLVVILAYPEPTDSLCAAQVWVGHIGSVVSFLVILYLGLWTGLDPPRRKIEELSTNDTSSNERTRAYQCRSDEAWWYLAIYMFEFGFLLFGVILAWQIRNVDDRFNESRAISMSLYATIFIAGIMVGLLSTIELEPDGFYAILSVSLIAGVLTVQGILFGPRIYDLIFGFESISTHHSGKFDSKGLGSHRFRTSHPAMTSGRGKRFAVKAHHEDGGKASLKEGIDNTLQLAETRSTKINSEGMNASPSGPRRSAGVHMEVYEEQMAELKQLRKEHKAMSQALQEAKDNNVELRSQTTNQQSVIAKLMDEKLSRISKSGPQNSKSRSTHQDPLDPEVSASGSPLTENLAV
ncbi:hypothetical protein AAMO2058_001721800 [Amorphochlora amoebiformis]